MPLPIRLVCAYCLSSVEASADGDPRSPATCPSCGSPIENGSPGSGSWGATTSHESTPTAAPAPAPRPMTVGRFVLGEWLGGGGYGDVFRASDPRLEREVALKVLKGVKLDSKAAERFFREARAAAKLDHPNIVTILDAGRDDGRLWIAYRLVEGRTLSQLRDDRSLRVREAVELVRDLAEALDHAHRRNVTHRDLKPANVLIDGRGRPFLTDFGLARRTDLDSELTTEGTVLGTPAYMSPEQAAGRANLADGRSDIYSLGVVLYELLCGRRPDDLPSNTPLHKIDRRTPPPTPHSLDRSIPQALDRICMKALAIEPAGRYQEASAFASDLDGWLRLHPPAPFRRTLVGLSFFGLLATVAVAALGAREWGGRRPIGGGLNLPLMDAPATGAVRRHTVEKPVPVPVAEAAPTPVEARTAPDPVPAPAEVAVVPTPKPTPPPVGKSAVVPRPPASQSSTDPIATFPHFVVFKQSSTEPIHIQGCPRLPAPSDPGYAEVVQETVRIEEARKWDHLGEFCDYCPKDKLGGPVPPVKGKASAPVRRRRP